MPFVYRLSLLTSAQSVAITKSTNCKPGGRRQNFKSRLIMPSLSSPQGSTYQGCQVFDFGSPVICIYALPGQRGVLNRFRNSIRVTSAIELRNLPRLFRSNSGCLRLIACDMRMASCWCFRLLHPVHKKIRNHTYTAGPLASTCVCVWHTKKLMQNVRECVCVCGCNTHEFVAHSTNVLNATQFCGQSTSKIFVQNW